MKASLYPKPKEAGGKLIRRAIGLLRQSGLDLPVTSHILIAVSGGADSIALARLLLKYGRRMGARAQFSILHINHGWRGEASDGDEAFVRRFAESEGVPFILHRLKPPGAKSGESWEDAARTARKRIFEEESRNHGGAFVFTAHHADDLAETVLWRIFTGAAQTHGGGIVVRHESEIRPLLTTRKSELLKFLREENLSWREDETNFEERFLRARMRKEVLPAVERLFPRAVSHLTRLAIDAQRSRTHRSSQETEVSTILLGAAGIRPRRSHWEEILREKASIDLPGGWRLKRESSQRASQKKRSERWVLERS